MSRCRQARRAGPRKRREERCRRLWVLTRCRELCLRRRRRAPSRHDECPDSRLHPDTGTGRRALARGRLQPPRRSQRHVPPGRLPWARRRRFSRRRLSPGEALHPAPRRDGQTLRSARRPRRRRRFIGRVAGRSFSLRGTHAVPFPVLRDVGVCRRGAIRRRTQPRGVRRRCRPSRSLSWPHRRSVRRRRAASRRQDARIGRRHRSGGRRPLRAHHLDRRAGLPAPAEATGHGRDEDDLHPRRRADPATSLPDVPSAGAVGAIQPAELRRRGDLGGGDAGGDRRGANAAVGANPKHGQLRQRSIAERRRKADDSRLDRRRQSRGRPRRPASAATFPKGWKIGDAGPRPDDAATVPRAGSGRHRISVHPRRSGLSRGSLGDGRGDPRRQPRRRPSLQHLPPAARPRRSQRRCRAREARLVLPDDDGAGHAADDSLTRPGEAHPRRLASRLRSPLSGGRLAAAGSDEPCLAVHRGEIGARKRWRRDCSSTPTCASRRGPPLIASRRSSSFPPMFTCCRYSRTCTCAASRFATT